MEKIWTNFLANPIFPSMYQWGALGQENDRVERWDVLREQHWNKYTIQGETDHQPRLDTWDKCSGLVHWDDPEGWDGEGGGRGGSGWGTHVNPWLIHVSVWQKPLQYCKVVSLQLIKINEKKKKKAETLLCQQRKKKRNVTWARCF